MSLEIKVPYLSYEQIGEISFDLLTQLNYHQKIPVPIEEIIEFHFKINIIPIPDLLEGHDIDGWTSSDLTCIYVDEFIFQHRPARYRFTLAHELGHVVLHKEIFLKFTFNKVEDWKNFYKKVDEKSYAWLESQAYNFAGLILVPKIHLAKYFKKQLKIFKSSIENAHSKKLKRNNYLDYIKDLISVNLASIFDVSNEVIMRRIEKDNLIDLIP